MDSLTNDLAWETNPKTTKNVMQRYLRCNIETGCLSSTREGHGNFFLDYRKLSLVKKNKTKHGRELKASKQARGLFLRYTLTHCTLSKNRTD